MPATFKPTRWVHQKEVTAVVWPGGEENAQNVIKWLGEHRWIAEYKQDKEQGEYIWMDTYGPPREVWPGWVVVWDGIGARTYSPSNFRRNYKRVPEVEYKEEAVQDA